MKIPTICRYCAGVIKLVPASTVYGEATERKNLSGEYLYQCQNCNARVGCHKGTVRPFGDVANEALRLKRIETHQVFDAFWKAQGMTRTQAYKWAARELNISGDAHIGGFEMDNCERLIQLCRKHEKTRKDEPQ